MKPLSEPLSTIPRLLSLHHFLLLLSLHHFLLFLSLHHFLLLLSLHHFLLLLSLHHFLLLSRQPPTTTTKQRSYPSSRLV